MRGGEKPPRPDSRESRDSGRRSVQDEGTASADRDETAGASEARPGEPGRASRTSTRPALPETRPALAPGRLPQRYPAVTSEVPLHTRVATWLDQRTGYSTLVRLVVNEPIPGGARWWYVFGAVLTFLLALQFLTGVLLATAYAPSATTAWASTVFIQDVLTLGWFVRGLHSFGSSGMLVLAGAHLAQVVIFGAYKAPREMSWLTGLAMLALLVAFAVTGYGLPWDEGGYAAKQVEIGIIGDTPVVGPWLQVMLQGGNAFGSYTVIRLSVLHGTLLPAGVVVLLLLHILLVRKHGLTPRWESDEAALARATQSYWPHQALRDTSACGITFVLLGILVVNSHGAELGAPADPTGGYGAPPRPEWYVLPLHQLRHWFQGSLQLVGTLVLPGLAALALAALPWLDRAPSRAPGRRKPVLGAALLGLAAVGVLGYLPLRRDGADAGLQRARDEASERARRARQLAAAGVPPEGGMAVYRNDPAFLARELWNEHCARCHSLTEAPPGEISPGPARSMEWFGSAANAPLEGDAGVRGPNLKGMNSRAWIEGFLRNPDGPSFMGGASLTDGMKPVEGTDAEIRALTELVYAESGAKDADGELVAAGEALFSEKDCDSCHFRDGNSENTGPNLKGRGTLPYLVDVIADAGAGHLYGKKNKMPRFADKLTSEEIGLLARFVLAQSR